MGLFFYLTLLKTKFILPADKNNFFIKASNILLTLPITNAEFFDLAFLVPEIFLFISLIVILLQYTLRLVAVVKEHQKQTINNTELNFIQFDRIVQFFNIGTLVTTNKVIFILQITLLLLLFNPITWLYSKFLLNGFLISTPTLVFIKLILIGVSIIILKSNIVYLRYDGIRTGDVSIVLGYITFSLLLFVQTYDFFVLFILFEIIALLFYIAIALRQFTTNYTLFTDNVKLTKYQKFSYHLGLIFPESSYTILASFTYFLLNILITGIFLFSISCLMLIYQTTHFTILIQYFYLFDQYNLPVVYLSIIGIITVFFFKLSVAPFHWWILAVFEGAPLITIMFLAIPLKIAIFVVLTRLLNSILYSLVFIWQPMLIVGAILSMVIGGIGLSKQIKLKRFWAYSTINHMGYLLLGLSTDSFLGLRATFIYLVGYILINLGFFILMVSLTNVTTQQRITTINQFALIRNFRHTILAVLLSIILFSLIGIPPLLGFWGKYLILSAVLVTLPFNFSIIIIIIVIGTTIITTACYLRIWKTLFILKPINAQQFDIHPFPVYNLKWLGVVCIGLIILPFFQLIPAFQILNYLDLFLYQFY